MCDLTSRSPRRSASVSAQRTASVKMVLEIICLATFLLTSTIASAEAYLGIAPGTDLASIRAKFQNATFTDLKPAWAPKTLRLYQMQGYGLGGMVVIKFDDIRPILKESMNLESIATGEDDPYFVASGFRFIPDEPVKLDLLIKKYGRPEKQGVDRNLNKFVSWLSRGVSATLSDKKEDYVSMVEYIYTKEEFENGMQHPVP